MSRASYVLESASSSCMVAGLDIERYANGQDRDSPPPSGNWYAGCISQGMLQVSGRISPFGGEMNFIAWIVLGLIAGAIAKAIMPGNDPGGIIVTMIIGIIGALIGGFLGSTLMGAPLTGFSIQSLLLAVVGALILLWIYRMATRGRTRVP